MRKIEIDIFDVNSPKTPRAEQPPPRVPKMLMLVIVLVMVLLALYTNAQRWRRSQIETVTITPADSPSASRP